MPLELEETVTRLLISTTSRFVGQFKNSDWSLDHAWGSGLNRDWGTFSFKENPLCRNYFVVSFRTEPHKFEGNMSIDPDYSLSGDVICTSMSILFGKRFDNHGCFESLGMFYSPVMNPTEPVRNPFRPIHNHKPRVDLGIELNLEKFGLVLPLLDDTSNIEPRLRWLVLTAGRFYWQALKEIEEDPVRAYLDLIMCGEILSNYAKDSRDGLLDEDVIADMTRIATELPGGDAIRKRLTGRLSQIKRRFVHSTVGLLNHHFFTNSEASVKMPTHRLAADNIVSALKAAYDVRSKHLHEGFRFGGSVLGTPQNEEIVMGFSRNQDESLVKLLQKSPTFAGLERVMRFCLLALLHRNGVPIDDRLLPDAESASGQDGGAANGL